MDTQTAVIESPYTISDFNTNYNQYGEVKDLVEDKNTKDTPFFSEYEPVTQNRIATFHKVTVESESVIDFIRVNNIDIGSLLSLTEQIKRDFPGRVIKISLIFDQDDETKKTYVFINLHKYTPTTYTNF